jgi:hypothetical protein
MMYWEAAMIYNNNNNNDDDDNNNNNNNTEFEANEKFQSVRIAGPSVEKLNQDHQPKKQSDNYYTTTLVI